MRYLALTVLVALTLAGCVGPPPVSDVRPAPVVTPVPRPTLSPLSLAVDWNDWPFTPGQWSYTGPSTEPRASFGTDQSLVMLVCNRTTRQLALTLLVGANANLVIRTTTLTRELPTEPRSQPEAGQPGTVSARLSANDPLLDAIAFSRGRFVIEQAGQPAFVLPPHAEIGRVIEDCRG